MAQFACQLLYWCLGRSKTVSRRLSMWFAVSINSSVSYAVVLEYFLSNTVHAHCRFIMFRPLVPIIYIPEISEPLNLPASWPALRWRSIPVPLQSLVAAPLHTPKSNCTSGHTHIAPIGWRGTRLLSFSPAQCGWPGLCCSCQLVAAWLPWTCLIAHLIEGCGQSALLPPPPNEHALPCGHQQ